VERDIWLLNEEGLDGRSLFDVRLIGAGPFEFYLLSNMVHALLILLPKAGQAI